MRRLLQRLAAGLVLPLLLLGGVAGPGSFCPARLGIAVEDPCPCEHAVPGDGPSLVRPCCCDEVGSAPSSSAPVTAADVERVSGPEAPILIVGEGLSLAVADAASGPVPVDRPAGAGPPILRRTSILLI